MLDNTGFSVHHFPTANAAAESASFSMHAVFRSQPVAKNIAGMPHATLVSDGFFN